MYKFKLLSRTSNSNLITIFWIYLKTNQMNDSALIHRTRSFMLSLSKVAKRNQDLFKSCTSSVRI